MRSFLIDSLKSDENYTLCLILNIDKAFYETTNKCENLGFKSECYVYFKKRKGGFTLFFIYSYVPRNIFSIFFFQYKRLNKKNTN
jgi:hypothetical protein